MTMFLKGCVSFGDDIYSIVIMDFWHLHWREYGEGWIYQIAF